MLAKAVFVVPERDDLVYEPKWDGFRCIVFRDGDEIELGSRNSKSLNRYFPELIEPLKAVLPQRCVVDGELIVRANDELNFDALSQRIHPAESRVNLLAVQSPAEFIAFDILALDDRDLTDVPFGERRAELERIAATFAAPIHLTPSTSDHATAVDWFNNFEGAGLDGLMAKSVNDVYGPNKRSQIKVKHKRSVECVVAGYRTHKSGDGPGSLLLGLYDDAGTLHHVGVAASFRSVDRVALIDELKPLESAALVEHPWANWAEAKAQADGTMPGSVNRWNATHDQSWTPLRIEQVVEVTYAHASAGRFRGTTKMVRWRPDREPASCLHSQLVQAEPFAFGDVLNP